MCPPTSAASQLCRPGWDVTHRGLAVSHSVQEGTSALMSAAAHGHLDVVDALMAAGAAVNGTNNAGTTALMMASEWGHTTMIEKLVAVGAQVNARTQVRACGKGREWHCACAAPSACGCSCPLSSHARVAYPCADWPQRACLLELTWVGGLCARALETRCRR